MSLIDLKNYLRQQQQVTLTDLVNHFNTEPDVMRTMLNHWQNKGKVVQVHHHNGCGKGCNGCCQQTIELYCWQDESVPMIFKANY